MSLPTARIWAVYTFSPFSRAAAWVIHRAETKAAAEDWIEQARRSSPIRREYWIVCDRRASQ